MKTTVVGQRAERAAATYISELGYHIVTRNWRTRWCEIDIVARKGTIVYFIEVKYRASSAWGDGLDYITPKKLRQMTVAAEMYLTRRPADDCCLAAIAVSGPDFTVDTFIEL